MLAKCPRPILILALLVFSSPVCLIRSVAQQQPQTTSTISPLARLLQSKGILTAEEVSELTRSSSAADADQRLARLLLFKGVISQADFDQMASPAALVNSSASVRPAPPAVPAVYRVPLPPDSSPAPSASASAASPSAATFPAALPNTLSDPDQTPVQQTGSVSPTTLSAANPIRVFPVGGIPKGELKPGIKLAGIGITPYGFLKATFIHDSSSPNGDDFPLPGFLGDTGPNAAPEFHVKARSTRLGTNFEWLDPSSNITITGKFEMDFEGNFNRSDNRNLSSIRSYNPSIRLAYGRIDFKLDDKNNVNLLFGQDWTPFTSSTLPNILETTALGIGFGVLWERAPQFRFGYTHNFGGFQFMPEVAVVLPAVGLTPSAANLSNQLGYGERQGPDSASPQMEGRFVGQWKLDHAPGVAPAQIIFSWEEGHATSIVLGSAIAASSLPASYKTAFATGARVTSDTNGWDAEWQLPTRFATLIGKFYSGSDLRYYFGGQLFSTYNATGGYTGVGTVTSIDGASTVAFGLNPNGVPSVIPQLPVRARGGFMQLGLPVSRWFGLDPEGRNAGWSAYLMYGTDQANTNDLLKISPVNSSRARSDMSVGTLNYKLNKWVSFSYELSLYRTRANTATEINPTTGLPNFPLFEGIPQHEWRDLRNEGGVIFSF